MRSALRSYSQQKRTSRILQYTFLILFFGIMVMPLVVMISTALKDESEIYMQESFTLIPKAWKFSNFASALMVDNWGRYFFNSLFITSIAVAGSLFKF